jgi:hypothetical protein
VDFSRYATFRYRPLRFKRQSDSDYSQEDEEELIDWTKAGHVTPVKDQGN